MLSASRSAKLTSWLETRGGGFRGLPGELPQWSVLRRHCVHAAQRLGSDQFDAEDLAQEAVARLLPVLSSVEKPEAWLRAVVRNLFWRQQRRRAARARVYSELAGQHSGDDSPAARHTAGLDVSRVLARLSPRSRRLLELVLAGHTHRDIAVVLKCEIHQVGPRIRRALATARRRLDG
jgi:RNA polymerase sigma factor (sigma-70 family)